MAWNSAKGSRGRVTPLRHHERIRIIAPVVAQAPAHQPVLVEEGRHRQKLDRGDPEPDQMLEHRRVGEAQEAPALSFRYLRVQGGEPLDVGLVEDGPAPGRARPSTAGRGGRHDHGLGHEGGGIPGVEHERLVRVDEVGPGPAEAANQGLGIRVEQQPGRVETMALVRCPAPVRPEPVDLARAQARHMAVEDLIGALGQHQPGDLDGTCGIEQAQLDLFGMGREDGEVDPVTGRAGAQGPGPPGLGLRLHHPLNRPSAACAGPGFGRM